MKNFFDIWNNYTTLNIVGFLFFGIAYLILPHNPLLAIEIFGTPFCLFLGAIYIKFF